jgi:hypothetical protein
MGQELSLGESCNVQYCIKISSGPTDFSLQHQLIWALSLGMIKISVVNTVNTNEIAFCFSIINICSKLSRSANFTPNVTSFQLEEQRKLEEEYDEKLRHEREARDREERELARQERQHQRELMKELRAKRASEREVLQAMTLLKTQQKEAVRYNNLLK